MVRQKEIFIMMFVSSENESAFTDIQIESLDLFIPKNVRDEFWHQDIFSNTDIRKFFESQIVELEKSETAIFKDEYIRGIAWLSFRYTGLFCTELTAKLEFLPLFKKYSSEFDTALTFEVAALVGYRYFPTDQFDMIGGQY
jgi:hypothetical protein